MSYYQLLGLDREPFSTSPDPNFLYLSRMHQATLFRLRTAVELKRGLNVVFGDIGTGKTTLARRLSQSFYQDSKIDFYPILNPLHHGIDDFLKNLMATFKVEGFDENSSRVDCMQALEHYLFKRGLEENKTIVLLIDEAQQLSDNALEILRALLNYETNEHKLLQVILFGQNELIEKLRMIPNFWDRISMKARLTALGEQDTSDLISFRLKKAGYEGATPLFDRASVKRIYKESNGFPRRIIGLCHDALEYLVMNSQKSVDRRVIRELVEKEKETISAFG